MVSESSDQSWIEPLTCIDFVIKEVEGHTNLTKIIMWSNGDYCASDFSCFVKLLENYRIDLQLEGSYNEVDHRKSTLDGIREQ